MSLSVSLRLTDGLPPTTMATMRAVRFHRSGGPEVLVLDDVPRPDPGPGEIRVRIAHAGVNFVDAYLRSGSYDPGPLPATAGKEGAGRVDAIGTGVEGVSEGDQVAFFDAKGAYAEWVVIPAARAIGRSQKSENRNRKRKSRRSRGRPSDFRFPTSDICRGFAATGP